MMFHALHNNVQHLTAAGDLTVITGLRVNLELQSYWIILDLLESLITMVTSVMAMITYLLQLA
jgi:hypothetical protein